MIEDDSRLENESRDIEELFDKGEKCANMLVLQQ